jgi:hypothetical protein
VFQNVIRQTLTGLDGAINVNDDILVWGNSAEKHDRHQNAVPSKLKCRFRQTEIKFYGFIFSRKGIQADPEKIVAVISLDTPESCDAVRSFNGMANYVWQFIPGFAGVASLRE